MRTNKTAMILAAGKGTRLSKLTQNQPKALVKINGVRLLDRVINQLEINGFQHFVINVHHFADQIIDQLQRSQYQHLQIDISDESAMLLDTGGGLLNARKYFTRSETVLVHNVDILTKLDLKTITDLFAKSTDNAWLLTQERSSSRKLLFNEKQQLIGWHQAEGNAYKWVGDPFKAFSELAFSGIHLFRPACLEMLALKACNMIDMYLQIAKNKSVKSFKINPDYWFDIGKIADFEENEKFFMQLENN